MLRICALSKKGGVGKTTLLVLLYEALKQAGSEVLLQDYDAQGSATKALRAIGAVPAKQPTITLFDTPPNLVSAATDTAVRQSDIILIPTSPSPLDLWEAGESAQFAQGRASKAKVVVVLNRAKATTILGGKSREFLEGIKVNILPITLGDRQSYQRATLDGWAALDATAREEVLAFCVAVTNLR